MQIVFIFTSFSPIILPVVGVPLITLRLYLAILPSLRLHFVSWRSWVNSSPWCCQSSFSFVFLFVLLLSMFLEELYFACLRAYHLSFHFLIMVRNSSRETRAFWICLRTLVGGVAQYEGPVTCSNISFPRHDFLFKALRSDSTSRKCIRRWMWPGISVIFAASQMFLSFQIYSCFVSLSSSIQNP